MAGTGTMLRLLLAVLLAASAPFAALAGDGQHRFGQASEHRQEAALPAGVSAVAAPRPTRDDPWFPPCLAGLEPPAPEPSGRFVRLARAFPPVRRARRHRPRVTARSPPPTRAL